MSDPGKAVFLSYASQDAEAAKRICEALRAAGVEVWFDQSELVGGDAWDQKIRKQIKDCALLIPVISAATQARTEGYFRLEWRLADQRTHLMGRNRAFLLPVTIDGTSDADADVPDSFVAVQWTKAPGGAVPPAFVARVQKLLAGEPNPGSRGSAAEGQVGQRRSAPVDRSRRPGWLVPAILGALTLAGVAGWLALRPTPMATPSSGPGPAATKPAANSALVAKAWALLNKADLSRSDWELADTFCRQATEQDPNDADAWAAWSQADSWASYHNFDRSPARRESARTRAARALQLAPQEFESRLAHACQLVRGAGQDKVSNFEAEAERVLQALLQAQPDEPRALLAMGILQRNLQHVAGYQDTFGRLARNPAFATLAWNELGWAEYFNGNKEAADAAIKRSIALQPYWGNLILKLIMAVRWRGDLDEAKAALERIPLTSLQEDNAAGIALDLDYWRREPEAMLARLAVIPRDWMSSNAFDGPTAFWSGRAYSLAGRQAAADLQWRTALAVVEGRLAQQPNSARLIYWKGMCLARLGKTAEAAPLLGLARDMGYPGEPATGPIALGETEAALAELEAAADSKPARITAAELRLDPMLDPLRTLPRFQALLARLESDPRHAPQAKPAPAAAPAVSPAVTADSKSVAVLAFANLSDDKGNEYFSDGISEELLNVLAKVPGLKVSARTSAFFFKGKQVPLADIAQQLGVAYVIEGSVRKAGDKVRITAQLIKASDGFHVWSNTFTRDLKDIFAVQDEIAGLIAQQLQLKLGGAVRPPRTVDPEVHRLALEGRHFWFMRTDASIARAETAYLQARQLDPEFAEAHLGLANVWMVRGWYASLQGAAAAPDFALARESAEEALRLDPTLSEAYAVLGGVAHNQWRFAEAEQAFQTALRMNPNYSFAHHWHAHLLMARGRLDESLVELERAVQLDPLQFVTLVIYALHLQFAGRYAEALEVCERAQALTPNFFVPLQAARATSLHQLGRTDEARAEVRRVIGDLSVKPRWWADGEMVRLLREDGQEQAAADHAARVISGANEESSAQQTALAALGRTEEALVSLERARPGASGIGPVFYTPAWAAVRQHPRFAEVLARLGILDEYQTAQATKARMLKEQEAKP
ncbi:MAG: hypothetical protein QG602_3484 [Verrucomicrobiota bacterium]|nr:hypothetical protein [Verrucomicrobiota bacterium]